MKHFARLVLCTGFFALTQLASTASSTEPFKAITRKNVFRLNPPASEIKAPVPIERPEITLEGFTTILGRAQVLLNIRPIKAAGCSWVMSERENQDGVTIIGIDLKNQTVRLNNLGLEQLLALKR